MRLDEFWTHVDRRGPDDCWEWQGARNNTGRGNVRVGRKHFLAHRVAFELSNGPIPSGILVCHACDNGACCNPSHLWLGTQQDNMRDHAAKGRASGRYRAKRAYVGHRTIPILEQS